MICENYNPKAAKPSSGASVTHFFSMLSILSILNSFKVVRALKLNKEYAKKLDKKPKPPLAAVATLPVATVSNACACLGGIYVLVISDLCFHVIAIRDSCSI